MTEEQWRNIGMYVLIAFGAALLATGTHLGAVLSTDDPILWRPLSATFVTVLFGTLATAAGAAFRPRAGREVVSALVNEVGVGNATAALEVAAIKQSTGVQGDDVYTPMQLTQVADELERRMRTESDERLP